MGYKVGDEVLVKAVINDICVGKVNSYEVKAVDNPRCESSVRVIYVREEDVLPVPTMTAEETWEIARRIILSEHCGGLSLKEIRYIFGDVCVKDIIKGFSPQQAKARIEAWEAENEIKVGDEVEFDDTAYDLHRSMYVTSKYNDTDYCGICRNGDTYCVHKSELKKTGRHIDIEGLMEQIGGNERWKKTKFVDDGQLEFL